MSEYERPEGVDLEAGEYKSLELSKAKAKLVNEALGFYKGTLQIQVAKTEGRSDHDEALQQDYIKSTNKKIAMLEELVTDLAH